VARYYKRVDLIEGIRSRDGEVFDFINRRYKPSIIHLIRNYGGTQNDADDIFQDGIFRLIEIVDKPDFELKAEMSTLLYAICKKIWKLNLEKRRVADNYFLRKLDEDENADMNDVLDSKLYESIFLESFKKLQKDCQVILRALMKGIPVKEVAVTLDYSYDYLRRKKIVCHSYLHKLIVTHQDYQLIKKKEGSVRLY